MFKLLLSLVVAVALNFWLAPIAFGQSLDSVIVTGVRIDPDQDWTSASKPHITKRVRADLILMEITVTTGTIDRSEREEELRAMFERTVDAVNANNDMKLEAGTLDTRFAIETTSVSDIWSHYGNSGSFNLVLHVIAGANERFDDVQERGEDFIDGIDLAGRAQYDFGDDQYIGLRDIGAHRQDLLRSINADVDDLRKIFSASVIDVTGLESAIVTQPVDDMELELYIPYTVSLTKDERR